MGVGARKGTLIMALPQPTTHLVVKQGDVTTEVEVFRCQTDGAVVFQAKGYDASPLYKLHSGHRLNQPVVLRQGEIEEIMEELNLE